MWEIYAYQNADSLFGIFNAAAAIHGSGDYMAAVAAVAFCGFIAALVAYAFAPEKLQGWKWLATVLLVFSVLSTTTRAALPAWQLDRKLLDLPARSKRGGEPPRLEAAAGPGVSCFVAVLRGDLLSRTDLDAALGALARRCRRSSLLHRKAEIRCGKPVGSNSFPDSSNYALDLGVVQASCLFLQRFNLSQDIVVGLAHCIV